MTTIRQIALEASVRFTDRNKNGVKEMLKNADIIEEWLNREPFTAKFLDKDGVERHLPSGDPKCGAVKSKMRSAEQREGHL